MKINIEKYLKSKQGQFEVEQPDEELIWEGIRSKLHQKHEYKGIQFWKVAAIFLAIFTFSYILYNEIYREQERAFTLSQIDEGLGKRERVYQQLVLDKMQAANIHEYTANPDHQIVSELVDELTELDMIYQEAMNDLVTHGYLEQIVDIIFDTYEKRIRTLEQIIRETQKIELYENDEKNVRL